MKIRNQSHDSGIIINQCGRNATACFLKSDCDSIISTSDVEKMPLSTSGDSSVVVCLLHHVCRKLCYLIKETNLWNYRHLVWRQFHYQTLG